MLVDAADLSNDDLIQADVCVVGGGPAAITIARWLDSKSLDVCVIESGGLVVEEGAQQLNEGHSEGTLLPPGTGYERSSRLRTLGGASGHWGGVFRPLDPIDFEVRSWVRYSGWPFTASELGSYYTMACALCGVRLFDDAAELRQMEPSSILPDSPQFVSQVFHQNPIHFGTHYGRDLRRSRRIRVIFHATATEFVTGANGTAVERLRVQTLGAKRFVVRAKIYVLAAGGLENARMLLLSNGTRPNGLGNDRDQVGRYFMEHPHVPVGRIVIWRSPPELAHYMDFKASQLAGARTALALRLRDPVMRAQRLLNGNFTFVPLRRPFDPSRSAHESFLRSEVLEMNPGLTPPRPSAPGFEDLYRAYERQTALFDSVHAVASDLHAMGSSAAGPGVGSAFHGLLYARVEQAPNPESRVTLGDERDALDRRRLRLNWRLTSQDLQSALKSARIIGRELGRMGLGRAQALVESSMSWPVAGVGFHHMGTTRMHRDPAQGVTDPNCQVHGVKNLYVAGSSLFPTGGHANPTLTLLALALRLGDHIAATI